jgi:hypothetical protein
MLLSQSAQELSCWARLQRAADACTAAAGLLFLSRASTPNLSLVCVTKQ